jgi:hypothetical protein
MNWKVRNGNKILVRMEETTWETQEWVLRVILKLEWIGFKSLRIGFNGWIL